MGGGTHRLLVAHHWAGDCLDESCRVLELDALVPYDSRAYRWGGYVEGFRFFGDGTVQRYFNTHCSDESAPEAPGRDGWRLDAQGHLVVTGSDGSTRYRIVAISGRRLILKRLEAAPR